MAPVEKANLWPRALRCASYAFDEYPGFEGSSSSGWEGFLDWDPSRVQEQVLLKLREVLCIQSRFPSSGEYASCILRNYKSLNI